MLRFRKAARRAALMLPALLSLGAVEAAGLDGYEMNIYLGGAGSDDLLAGRYEEAVEKAASVRAEDRYDGLAAVTNLCVAYTVTRRFDDAEQACRAAVREARTLEIVPGSRFPRRDDTAKALSNLGVLTAVRGDVTEATARFQQAARIDAWEGALRNLAYIESGTIERIARRVD